jgi:hypothetical protein
MSKVNTSKKVSGSKNASKGKRANKVAKVELITTHSGGGKFTDKRPGVLATFNNLVMGRRTAETAISKAEVLAGTVKVVGERDKMETTLAMWLPSGVRQYHGITVKAVKRADGQTGYYYDDECAKLTHDEQEKRRKAKEAAKNARKQTSEAK